MWRSLVFLLAAIPCFAQTADTVIFRAVLLPASEVPAVNNLNARGVADVTVSVVRDASGQITSGTVDILARITFPAAVNATGLGVWSGAAGQNGPMIFATSLSPQTPYAAQPNGDSIHLAVQVATDGAAALRALLANPATYYVNIQTTANPNGAMRGQLQTAQKIVLMALLSSDNVVPPAYPPAYGAALLVVTGTQNAAGAWTSGEISCSATYSTQDQTAVNSLQIHTGAPGSNGPLDFSLPIPTLTPLPNGNGSIAPAYFEITATTAAQTQAFTLLFADPGALYADLRTTGSPNGSLRGQLHTTDAMAFPLLLSSANEPQTSSVTAVAAATLTLYALRNEDGSIAAADFLTDLDYRFPAGEQFLGLYIHAGPTIVVQIAPDFHSDTGFGNLYGRTLPFVDPVSIATLNDLVINPASYSADLHTVADPAGAIRAPFAAPPPSFAFIDAVVSANLDPHATALAPGGLITIYGANLAQVATGISGWSGNVLPFALNGVRVLIGGELAPLLYVSAGQINAQVPVDLAGPTAQVLVTGPRGPIASFGANVVAAAPAIFSYPVAAILRNSDFSLITAANPARPGDVLLVYATGLGATSPPLATGQVLNAGAIAHTTPVSATIGGKPATVIYSIASPSFPGLYQVAVAVPAALTGSVPLVLQEGGAASNSVTLAMR